MKYLLLFISLLLIASHLYAGEWYHLGETPPIRKLHRLALNNQSVEIASYSYPQIESKKTLTTIHGYMANCHYLEPIHQFFWDHGYHIQCFELPGHGHSAGAAYEIDDFKTYHDLFKKIQTLLNPKHKNIFLAHSTGNVGVVTSLLRGEKSLFHHHYLVTPLVRNNYFLPTKYAHPLLSLFIEKYPRSKRSFQTKLDQYYQLDPFYRSYTPAKWIEALIQWNDKLAAKSSIQSVKNITIFWGEQDRVIDTKYNRSFLQKYLPQAKVYSYPEGDHFPHFNPKTRQSFFNTLRSDL